MSSREQFEDWITAEAARENRVIRIVRERDWYAGRDKHFLNTSWSAWQASRAAVVVELPECFEKRDVQGLDYDKTVAAIEAAGVKVKS